MDIKRPTKGFRDACREQGVLVARDFPPLEKSHVRVSIGTLDEMKRATEVFVTNSVHGIMPVRSLADADVSWPAGPLSRRLRSALTRQPASTCPADADGTSPVRPRRTLRPSDRPVVLLIDNYDSFTYNLAHLLLSHGCHVEVIRNDVVETRELLERAPDRVVVSPGPGTPDDSGVSVEAIRAFAEAGTPVLGVCLGLQALAQGFGGRVVRGQPIHGKTASVEHDGRTIFEGLESPLVAGRYHSLVVDPDLPDCLERSAHFPARVLMAISLPRWRRRPSSTSSTSPPPRASTHRS